MESFATWKRYEIRYALCLTVHPDLAVSRAAEGAQSVTLLGFALDPARPEASDAQITLDLLRHLRASDRWETFLEATDDLGGRWVRRGGEGSGDA